MHPIVSSASNASNPRPAPATAMTDIQLRLTIDELNLVLEGIGNLPFARVFALVGKIQAQAGEQLQAQTPAAQAVGQAG